MVGDGAGATDDADAGGEIDGLGGVNSKLDGLGSGGTHADTLATRTAQATRSRRRPGPGIGLTLARLAYGAVQVSTLVCPTTSLPSDVARMACSRTYHVVPDGIPSTAALVAPCSAMAAHVELPSR